MKSDARLAQLERLSDLRVAASERQLSAAARAEAVARERMAEAERAMETFVTRLPHLRQQTYRTLGSKALNRGGIEILHTALQELDQRVDLYAADIDAARQQRDEASATREARAQSHSRLIVAQRRRAKLGEKLAEIAARRSARREELELEEWRRATPA